MRGLLICAALLAGAGCSMERHTLSGAGVSQTVRVESGDRLYLDLEEDSAHGCRWEAVCKDPDVDVKIRHVPCEGVGGVNGAPGRAETEIRVHRGYDGPSAVVFSYRRRSAGPTPLKSFTVTLFKRTGDCAFWE